MNTAIEVLTAADTQAILRDRPGVDSQSSQIAEALMQVVDSDNSVFVTGLTEANINVLRTKMYRRDIRVIVRKVRRDDKRGHVLFAKTVAAEER